ncbi:F0F1 ATP synthase subunit A [Magnetospirillum sp. 15-1]|uniref:F0F1 ATP synthase subunit A n=1 Tax=Magnetospirillum sp. 15-1 TaxID=1979370 RepID=UPI000BBC0FD8|nr:F0F1 ATP synthase subunit A [Magnetospirillum sp. 15-1]
MIDPLGTSVLFHLGPVPVSEPVVTTWGIMALLVAVFHLARRSARGRDLVEMLVETVATQIGDAIHGDPRPFVPLIGTLFLFLLVANLSGELPGVHAPTARLETAAALALTVFFAVHVFGVRQRGLRGYLGHYLKPTPLMLPMTILSELTRTLSLTVRLFGNMMSHELIIAILLSLSGLFVPVPLMVLGVLIGAIQAYIFAVLATVFLGAAVGTVEAG